MDAAKAELRRRAAEERRARDAGELSGARAAIRRAVLAQCRTQGWRCVAAYEPMRTEPGSVELLQELVRLGVRVLVPVTRPDRDLEWVRWEGRPSSVSLGTDAVGSVDAVLVPAFAVATDGTRLGRGGGSYDRVLARVPDGVPVAALVFDGECADELPRDPWDRPVTAVVTPSGWRAVD